MAKYDGLIIPRSYNEYINKTDPIAMSQALQLNGVMDDVPTAGSVKPVKSGGILAALAIPTDAVLHYSFDEVPDYPDGSADLLQTQFTSTTGWTAPSDITVSTENNSLKLVSTGSRQYVLATNSVFSGNTLKGKIVKIKVYSKDTIARCHIQEQNPSTYPEYQLTEISRSGNEYVFCGIMPSNMTYSSYLVLVFANATSKTAYIKSIYIGDGSYTTPVIDNANGQNNGTNNGGIAVQGVSGKGAFFPSATQEMTIPTTNLPAPTSNDNFTISLWVNISNDYVVDAGIVMKPIFCVGAYEGTIGICRRYINSQLNIEVGGRDTSNVHYVSLPVTKGQWCFISLVYNSTTRKGSVFLNGVKQGETTAFNTDFQFGSNKQFWTIMGNTLVNGNNVDNTSVKQPATIDDILLFNRALSQEEVTALYLNKANTPKYYGRADWKLQQMESAQISALLQNRTTEQTEDEAER